VLAQYCQYINGCINGCINVCAHSYSLIGLTNCLLSRNSAIAVQKRYILCKQRSEQEKAIQTLRQLLIQPQYIPDHHSPIHHARWQPDNAKLEMSWTRCSSSSSRPPPRDRERSPSAIINYDIVQLPWTGLAVGCWARRQRNNRKRGRAMATGRTPTWITCCSWLSSAPDRMLGSPPVPTPVESLGAERKVELSLVGCQRESIEIPCNTRTGS